MLRILTLSKGIKTYMYLSSKLNSFKICHDGCIMEFIP